jgi:hypothetical protein|nr:MAG TPA: hypothetical protein [Caudoviricetes sp.]
MARTIDYSRKAEKIKSQIDDLLMGLMEERRLVNSQMNKKIDVKDVDLDSLDMISLQQLQLRISRMILEKSR